MKNFILVLMCLMIVLPNLSDAQNKKKTKKNKKSKQEQVTPTNETQKEISPTLDSKPINSKPDEVKPVTIKKPETSKPENTTAIESKPINVEQIIAESKPIIQEKLNGQINWTEQYIEAKGVSVIDNERFKNPAQAKLMAKRGAIVDAQRNLLEIIKGVNVTSETTVNDMITTHDIYLRTR